MESASSQGSSMTSVLTKCFSQEKEPLVKIAPRKKRVVIIGGGFAGLAAARALKRADVEVLLLDRRNHHIFQPLLYHVPTPLLPPPSLTTPIPPLAATPQHSLDF